MGKGEIARSEQFLLFPQCFQKARFPGASKGVIVWEWVRAIANKKISVFEETVRKVVGGFGKKSCVRTGVRKPGNTCVSPTAMI